jgi:hypothetical protein
MKQILKMKVPIICFFIIIVLRLIGSIILPIEFWGINYMGFLEKTFFIGMTGLSLLSLCFWKQVPEILKIPDSQIYLIFISVFFSLL